MNTERHSRQIGIVQLLQVRQWTTATSLASRFDVTARTIYRDIDDLVQAGVPIESIPGPEGGYRLAADQPLAPLTIDADDALKLYIVSLLNRSQNESGDSELPEFGTSYSREALRRFSQRIYFDTADWYWKDEGSGHLPAVRNALLTGTALKIVLREKRSTTPSSQIVKPYGIVWKSGEWHLVAAPVDGPTQRYRFNFIDQVVAQRDLHCVYPEDFNLNAWWAAEMEAYGKGDIRVTLSIASTARDELLRLALKKNSQVRQQDNGGLEISLYVDRWEWLVPLLASYGADVQVTEPTQLRAAVLVHLQRAVMAYKLPIQESLQQTSGETSYHNDDSRMRSTKGGGRALTGR